MHFVKVQNITEDLQRCRLRMFQIFVDIGEFEQKGKNTY